LSRAKRGEQKGCATKGEEKSPADQDEPRSKKKGRERFDSGRGGEDLRGGKKRNRAQHKEFFSEKKGETGRKRPSKSNGNGVTLIRGEGT